MRVVEYEKIGAVRYVKKRGVKNISISVKPFSAVQVTMPVYVSYATAESFLVRKTDWVLANRIGFQEVEDQRTIYTNGMDSVTRMHTLCIEAEKRDNISLLVFDRKIVVRYPDLLSEADDRVQIMVRKGLEEAWRIEAKTILPDRVHRYACKFGFRYKLVKINKAKTRWGSCSYVNNINLCLYLMRLPDQLIDYVILHELVHTRHKDHGPKFWKRLEEVCPNALALNKELRQYKTQAF